jgi:hypothetical protein
MLSFIYLLAPNAICKYLQGKYVHFAVEHRKKFAKCSLLDTLADRS